MMVEERDLRNLCKTLIILRVICVGVALSLMAFLTGAGLDFRGSLPIAGLLLVVFPLSAIWWLVFKAGYAVRPLIYTQLVADLAVEGGVVYFTGGAQSHFAVLFLITIFLAGVVLHGRGAAIAATLSSAVFAGASLLERAHYRSYPAAEAAQARPVYAVLSVVLQMAFFYLLALLASYVSNKITVFGAKLRSTTSELERARLDTRLIIESMNSGLVTVDSNCVITELNRSAFRILGIRPEEATGRGVREVLGPVAPELCTKIMDAVENGDPEDRGEVLATTASGKAIPLGISVSLLSASDSKTAGAVVVFQDLTEVKTLAHKIRLSDRLAALGELSAGIAHEIRTPLASICGSIEMLRDVLAPEGEDGRIIDLVIKESERLRKKIDYFLQFASSRPAKFCEVNLNSILAEVVCLVRNHPHFSDRTEIEVEADTTAIAWVDEETMKQVFYNLAINAVEALDGSGKVTIRLDAPVSAEDGDCVRISFEDNGAGIDDEDLGRILEPFYTSKESGTGLGLAIAAKIVEDHGGRLEIESTREVGTVATVYLPLDKMKVEHGSATAAFLERLAETSVTRVE
jgi:two-component system sensor histidine kinase PilS (NtrC family)